MRTRVLYVGDGFILVRRVVQGDGGKHKKKKCATNDREKRMCALSDVVRETFRYTTRALCLPSYTYIYIYIVYIILLPRHKLFAAPSSNYYRNDDDNGHSAGRVSFLSAYRTSGGGGG